MSLTPAQIEEVQISLQPVNLETRFDDFLDEVYDFECVGGSFKYMRPSYVLKTCDPICYKMELSGYEDDSLIEIGSEYYDRAEVEDVLAQMEQGE